MINNKGYKIENKMKKWFKGKVHYSDSVDFHTKTTLYEVKSCQLYLNCNNGNYVRPYMKKPHKKVNTTRMGRFWVKIYNHTLLKQLAEEEHKKAKYIFVIVIGTQKVWVVKDWEFIDVLISKTKDEVPIRIPDIF